MSKSNHATEPSASLTPTTVLSDSANDGRFVPDQYQLSPPQLLPVFAAPETLLSLTRLNLAAHQRIFQTNCDFFTAWGKWLTRAAQLQRANTLSKRMEQEVNLTMSAAQIIGNQFVNLASLQENFQVNYSYWVAQQTKQNQEPQV